ncbi:leucyl aminopeptidase family protein [Leptospira sp. GIMC2001]|uniref:leucyl aminopeptidase family protein n=1 Tax=Leptospira sp. GIMC2001 TaxID=1513297 RepID=UPI00234A73F1|nr:leucyl aminopeptidase [Leptospira sp. GIMC2001]WCL50186.1 leucyl aminopeptidase [Leptospira sp. GIMC2001]
MKIESTPIRYSFGENQSEFVYKTHFVFAEENKNTQAKKFAEQWKAGIFTGEMGQIFTDEASKTILIGLGDPKKLLLRKVAAIFIKLGARLAKYDSVGYQIYFRRELLEILPVQKLTYQIANSIDIGYYKLNVLATKNKAKEKKKPGGVSFLAEDTSVENDIIAGIKKSQAVAKHVNGARYIAHLPANHFTPEEFVSRSREIAKEHKLKVTVLDEPQLKKLGMNGILTVGEGSDKKSKMILIDYKPVGAKKTFAIIGKGLTFDSGGISIKPSAEMHEMKYDMCGAAAAIHAIGAIAATQPKIRVVAAIGVAENMPDAKAVKPGDVYTAYNGLTIEVQNTDAEGRLVLGDVLSYVCDKIKPDYMVDLATLTGAAIIALGHEAAAVLSNNEDLTSAIKKASLESDDRTWELPLWDEYGEDLKSDIADLKNITGGRGAGTISGAMYLSNFVDSSIPWAHLDIAGAAWRKKASGTQPNGPTGYGVRLLVELASILSEK